MPQLVVNGATNNGTPGADIFIIGNIDKPTFVNGGEGFDIVDVTPSAEIGEEVFFRDVERLQIFSAGVTIAAEDLQEFESISGPAGQSTDLIFSKGGVFVESHVTGLAQLDVTGASDDDRVEFTTNGIGPTRIVFNAGTGKDFILTGAGNDTLNGGEGDDTLSGGDGHDSIAGGPGADDLFGEAGNDTLVAGNGDEAEGGAGDDRIEAQGGSMLIGRLTGGTGTDTFDAQGIVSLGSGVVIDGVENLALDSSTLSLSADQLDEFERIVADSGATLGRIALTAPGAAALKVEGLGQLLVTGSAGNDFVFLQQAGSAGTRIEIDGGAGNDVLETATGADTLRGGLGNDTIRAGDADVIDGGAGEDRITLVGSFGPNPTVVGTGILAGGDGSDTLFVTGKNVLGAGVSVSGIETLRFNPGELTLSAAQLDGFNSIDTGLGSTTVKLNVTTGGIAAVTGVFGESQLEVAASGGDDLLTFVSFATDMLVNGGSGDDSISTGFADDTLIGGNGADTLVGNGGNDVIEGAAGDDLLNGGSGTDAASYVNGPAVRVNLALTVAQDTSGAGFDQLSGIENLIGSGFNDTLTGDVLDNRLNGLAGNDVLRGGAGSDELQGGFGNDTLWGGAGEDGQVGGAGSDLFLFRAGDGIERVADFQDGADRLSFQGFGTGFDTAAELLAVARQVGSNVVFELPERGGTTTEVTLNGVSLANLTAADFGPIIA